MHAVPVPLPSGHLPLRAAIYAARRRSRIRSPVEPLGHRPALLGSRQGRPAMEGTALRATVARSAGGLAHVRADRAHSRTPDARGSLPIRPSPSASECRDGRRGVAAARAAPPGRFGPGRLGRRGTLDRAVAISDRVGGGTRTSDPCPGFAVREARDAPMLLESISEGPRCRSVPTSPIPQGVDGEVGTLRHRGPSDILSRSIGADRKSTRLNSSHQIISYAVFFL